jgi:hypothetical protein
MMRPSGLDRGTTSASKTGPNLQEKEEEEEEEEAGAHARTHMHACMHDGK